MAQPIMTDERTEHGRILAEWARARLEQELGGAVAHRPDAPWCRQPGATFVSLRWRDGQLQGCIGTLEARRPIALDVERNVLGAALRDPRAMPMGRSDVKDLDVEVHVLSPLTPIPFDDEESALAALRPDEDGVVLEYKGDRATFLPVMWKQLPDRKVFMGELKQKAGLSTSFWDDGVRLFRYTAEHYVDPARPD